MRAAPPPRSAVAIQSQTPVPTENLTAAAILAPDEARRLVAPERPRAALPPIPVVEFDYLAATLPERDAFDCGRYWGRREGVEAGRAQAADEAEQSWAVMAAGIRRVASHGPYSRLAELRGEPERAAQARVHEARVTGWVDL